MKTAGMMACRQDVGQPASTSPFLGAAAAAEPCHGWPKGNCSTQNNPRWAEHSCSSHFFLGLLFFFIIISGDIALHNNEFYLLLFLLCQPQQQQKNRKKRWRRRGETLLRVFLLIKSICVPAELYLPLDRVSHV